MPDIATWVKEWLDVYSYQWPKDFDKKLVAVIGAADAVTDAGYQDDMDLCVYRLRAAMAELKAMGSK